MHILVRCIMPIPYLFATYNTQIRVISISVFKHYSSFCVGNLMPPNKFVPIPFPTSFVVSTNHYAILFFYNVSKISIKEGEGVVFVILWPAYFTWNDEIWVYTCYWKSQDFIYDQITTTYIWSPGSHLCWLHILAIVNSIGSKMYLIRLCKYCISIIT